MKPYEMLPASDASGSQAARYRPMKSYEMLPVEVVSASTLVELQSRAAIVGEANFPGVSSAGLISRERSDPNWTSGGNWGDDRTSPRKSREETPCGCGDHVDTKVHEARHDTTLGPAGSLIAKWSGPSYEIANGVIAAALVPPSARHGGVSRECMELNHAMATLMGHLQSRRIAYEAILRSDALCGCANGPADCYSWEIRMNDNRRASAELLREYATATPARQEFLRSQLIALQQEAEQVLGPGHRDCASRLADSATYASERLAECGRIRQILVEKFNELNALVWRSRRSIVNLENWARYFQCTLLEYGQTDFERVYAHFEGNQTFLRPMCGP